MNEKAANRRGDLTIVGIVTSASWQCPVCNQRGDLHESKCFVLELANAAITARREGWAACYARQVILAMKGESEDLWCAVEGCQEPATLYDIPTNELVCRTHLDYGL